MDSGPSVRPFVLLLAPCSPFEAVWEEPSPFTSLVNPPGSASLATCVNMHHAMHYGVNGILAGSHYNHGKERDKDNLPCYLL